MRRIEPTCAPDSSVCSDTNAAMSLLYVMQHLSTVSFGSTWAPHTDRVLWREMHSPQRIKQFEAYSLKYLHREAGGWWSWRRDEAPGPTFLPTDVWKLSLLER